MASKNNQGNFNEMFDKMENDEEFFAVRAQDKSSAKTVAFWVMENINNIGTPAEKLREAFECAIKMRGHEQQKDPD